MSVAAEERNFLFSSESVNEGHPDKLSDQVSDAVLDACLKADPFSKVACETATKDNMVMVFGEITTAGKIDYDAIVRAQVREIGFDSFVDDLTSVDSKGLSCDTCEVLVRINKQSPDIAGGVHVGKSDLDVGAGDQGIMFGYASDETENFMPLTHMMATQLGKRLTDVRKDGSLWWLRPDGKTQVTIEYKQHTDGAVTPLKIHTVVISTQHAEPKVAKRTTEQSGKDNRGAYTGDEQIAPSMDEMNELIHEHVVMATLKSIKLKNGSSADSIYDRATCNLHINPSGKFIIGGPQGDAGLTGRKIIIDTYGGWGAHGGGAFSGKDPTKVDRSAAYASRWMAKSVVKAGLCKRACVQLSYAIGVAKPLSLFVETYGTEKEGLTAALITDIVKMNFDCRPGALARDLSLREPKYNVTAAYCPAVVAGVTMTGVETVRLSDTTTTSATVNLAGVVGLTNIQSFGSAAVASSFTNVGNTVDLSLANTSGTGTVTLGYTTAATTGTNAQNIALDNATGTGITTIAGVETFALTATGNSDIDLVAAAATSLTLNAADATTLTLTNALNTSLTSVTAVGSVGAATMEIDFDLAEVSVTGGDGADLINISTGALGLNDSIDGGAGNDTIKYEGTVDRLSAAIVSNALSTISNVETLELEGDDDGGAGAADYTVDMDSFEGVTSLVLDGNDTNAVNIFTLNDLSTAQMAGITVQAVAGGATVILDAKDGAGASDTATIAATLGSSAGTLLVTDSTAAGAIENLVLTATGNADQTVAITAGDFVGDATNDGSITISGGAADRTMTISNALTADTVNLSGVLSDLTVTLGVADIAYTGGAGKDTITMAATLTSADAIDGGAGTTDILSIAPTTSSLAALTISNVETLRIGGQGTATNNFAGVTGVTSLDIDISTAATGTQTLQSFTGLTSIKIDADSNTSANNDYQAVTITNGFTGAADALSIDINSDGTNGMNGTEGLISAAGVETLTITLDGGTQVQMGGFTSTTLSGVTVTANSDFVSTDTAVLGTITGGTGTILAFDTTGAAMSVSATVVSLGSNASVTLGNAGTGTTNTFDAGASPGVGITINGGTGIDNITGSAQADIITSGAGNDIIATGGGVDVIDGGAGNDAITGVDAVIDTFTGGAGNDTLNGDGGLDVFTGGAGTDIFTFGANVDATAADMITITDAVGGLGGDIFKFDISAVAGSVAAAATLSVVNVAASATNSFIIDTAGGNYTNVAAFEAAIEAATNNTLDWVGMYYDTTDDVVYIVADAASNIVGSTVVIGSLTNLTTAVLADAFLDSISTSNLSIY